MGKKRVIILGAGISGLTAAYALKDKEEVILLEKKPHAGGVMHSMEKEGFFFECGPRTFRTKGSPHLLALCRELGLTEEMIASNSRARKRYVLFQKRLEETPSSPFRFFTSPLCQGHRFRMLNEWQQPLHEKDETIYEFAARRFGDAAASRFFDPLSLGIFGCDARQLSIRNCFPRLKEWECRYGSVTAGLLRGIFRKRNFPNPPEQLARASLFSFRKGTQMLIQALEKKLGGILHLQEEVISLQKLEKWVVKTTRGEYDADRVISALPPHALGRLLHDLAPEVAVHLQSIPMSSMTVVHFGYHGRILPCSGFGYLVPTSEQEKIMGVVFDSEIFPVHNRGEQTRLTVMMGGLCGEEAVSIARDALQRHLGIHRVPDVVHQWENKDAIPKMQIGHAEKIAAIQAELVRLLPQLHLIGNYKGHPSVEGCIYCAMAIKNREVDACRS